MEFSDKHSQIIEIGDTVNCDKTEDNVEFTGNVIGFKNEFVQVEDQEGNVFDMRDYECEID